MLFIIDDILRRGFSEETTNPISRWGYITSDLYKVLVLQNQYSIITFIPIFIIPNIRKSRSGQISSVPFL